MPSAMPFCEVGRCSPRRRTPLPTWRSSTRCTVQPTCVRGGRDLSPPATQGAGSMSTFPYDGRFAVHRHLPEHGTPRTEVLEALRTMAVEEDATWESGKCSGTMYCGDHEHYRDRKSTRLNSSHLGISYAV